RRGSARAPAFSRVSSPTAPAFAPGPWRPRLSARLRDRGHRLLLLCSSARQLADLRQQQRQQVADVHALLPAIVAMANGHCVFAFRFFAERVEINRQTKRRTRFVLAAIAPSDGSGIIIEYIHMRPQQ